MVMIAEAVVQKCHSCDFEFSRDEARECSKCHSSICPKCGECLCAKVKNIFSTLQFETN